MTWLARWSSTVRSEQWWEYKLIPTLSFLYTAAVMSGLSIISLWKDVLALLLSIAACAIFVSVSNDLADLESDARAGKPNRMAELSRVWRGSLLLLSLAAGLLFVIHWRDNPWLVGVYVGCWLIFTLYSAPPFRWKARGLLGVLADATGAHLLPAFVAILLVYRNTETSVDLQWLAAAAVWALAYGLRGILWHQIADAEHDRQSAVGTFVQRHGVQQAVHLASRVTLPAELAALAFLLWSLPSVVPVFVLAAYGALIAARCYVGQEFPGVVETRGVRLLLLQEYYDMLLPIAILSVSILKHPSDAIALILHLLLFPRRTIELALLVWRTVRRFGVLFQKR